MSSSLQVKFSLSIQLPCNSCIRNHRGHENVQNCWTVVIELASQGIQPYKVLPLREEHFSCAGRDTSENPFHNHC